MTIFVFICKIHKSEEVKQEVNCTVILPPLVFPVLPLETHWSASAGLDPVSIENVILCVTGHLCGSAYTQPEYLYFRDSKMGCVIFVA
jgi:hypothetical protein